MKIVSIFIPGAFEDALIYKGHLIMLSTTRSILKVKMDAVVAQVKERSPVNSPFFDLMFLRNDWLSGGQFDALMQTSEVQRAFLKQFDRLPTEAIPVNLMGLEQDQIDLNIAARSILDLIVYFDRLYIGTETGLFDAHIDVNDNKVFISPPRRRHDAPCISASARFGVINASCGDNGLFTAIEDFSRSGKPPVELMRRGNKSSVRTSWYDHNIMNYPINQEPTFIRTTRRKPIANDDEDDLQSTLAEISDRESSLDYLFNSLRMNYDVEEEDIQYTYNFGHNLLVRADKGGLFGLSLKEIKDENIDSMEQASEAILETKSVRRYKTLETPILSVETCNAGQVIETVDSVLLFSHDTFYPLVSAPVYGVHTFGSSRRYKNLIVATQEDGVMITSAFDETRLPTPI